MSHLVLEGYADVADSFEAETLLKAERASASIEERMRIRKAVLSGDIALALEQCNQLYPDLFDAPRHSALFFLLQQQRLIELIRQGQVASAIAFARSELAPRAQHQPTFLAELERIMSLLAFDSPQTQSPYAFLLSQQQRQAVASQFNLALLAQQSASSAHQTQQSSHLVSCMQAMHRMQATLSASHSFPTLSLVPHTLTTAPESASASAQSSQPTASLSASSSSTSSPSSTAPPSSSSSPSRLYRRSSMPSSSAAPSVPSTAAPGQRGQRVRGRASVGGGAPPGSSGGGNAGSGGSAMEDYEMV